MQYIMGRFSITKPNVILDPLLSLPAAVASNDIPKIDALLKVATMEQIHSAVLGLSQQGNRNGLRVFVERALLIGVTFSEKSFLVLTRHLHREMLEDLWGHIKERNVITETVAAAFEVRCEKTFNCELAMTVLEDAKKVGKANHAVYNSLLKLWAKTNVSQAMRVYHMCRHAEVVPSPQAYTVLLQACADQGLIHEGKKLAVDVVQLNVKQDMLLRTAIVRACSDSTTSGSADSIDQMMKLRASAGLEENPRMYNSLWKSLIKEGRGMEAFGVLEKLEQNGDSMVSNPNSRAYKASYSVTLNSLGAELADKTKAAAVPVKEMMSDLMSKQLRVPVGVDALLGACASVDINDAVAIVSAHNAAYHNSTATARCFQLLIKRADNIEMKEKLLELYLEKPGKIMDGPFVALLFEYQRERFFEKINPLVARMKEFDLRMDIACSIALTCFSNAKKYDEAREIWQEMRSHDVPPTTRALEEIMRPYGGVEGRQYLREAFKKGTELSIYVFVHLLRQCSPDEWQVAYELLDSMKRCGYKPTGSCYSKVIELCTQAKEYDVVQKVTKERELNKV